MQNALSNHLLLRALFCLFLSGCFTQVLLYTEKCMNIKSITKDEKKSLLESRDFSAGYKYINPFKPNRLAYLYQQDEPISNFRGVGLYYSFLFIIQILIEHSVGKQWNTWSASGLGLLCLHMSHKKDARLIWVKYCEFQFN